MNTNKKTHTRLVICLMIFIVLSVFLTAFIVYDKYLTPNKYQVLELSPIGGYAVLYNGEIYVNIYDSTLNIDNVYGEGKYQTLVKTADNYKEYDFDELVFKSKHTTYTDSSSKWLKLNVSDVASIYNNEYGQALSSENPKYGIIMINKDNTVSYIAVSDLIDGNTDVVKLNVSDITDVVTEDNNGYSTYLINRDGTKTDVNSYID